MYSQDDSDFDSEDSYEPKTQTFKLVVSKTYPAYFFDSLGVLAVSCHGPVIFGPLAVQIPVFDGRQLVSMAVFLSELVGKIAVLGQMVNNCYISELKIGMSASFKSTAMFKVARTSIRPVYRQNANKKKKGGIDAMQTRNIAIEVCDASTQVFSGNANAEYSIAFDYSPAYLFMSDSK